MLDEGVTCPNNCSQPQSGHHMKLRARKSDSMIGKPRISFSKNLFREKCVCRVSTDIWQNIVKIFTLVCS